MKRALAIVSVLVAVTCRASDASAPQVANAHFESRWLKADGAISTFLVSDPAKWLRDQEAFIRSHAVELAGLAPKLPVVFHLDEDFVAAARARKSIEVIDDCGDALCGVADGEIAGAWEIAELRAMFTPAAAPRRERDAYAAALFGSFHGGVDDLAADLLRAGVFARFADVRDEDDALIYVPIAASLIRFLDPHHEQSFAAMQAKLSALAPEGEGRWMAFLKAQKPAPAVPLVLPIHGATFSIVNRIEYSTIANGSRLELERLRGLGYNAISLIPFAAQRGSDSTNVSRLAHGPASETDLSMMLAAARAHRLGMQVVLKPHVWNWPGGDPTRIDPGDAKWPEWFAAYERVIVHEALLARAAGANALAIGTELTRSEARPEWHRLIAIVRALYHGPLIYAANFDAFARTPFWSELDAIGIDAYFPLSLKPDATDEELRAGAEEVVRRIGDVARRWRKPVILTELGYASTAAAWIEPWREHRDQPAVPRDQARAFAAMLDAVSHAPAIGGFLIWKYESSPGRRDDAGFLPKEKPAEAVIRKYLKSEG